MRETPRHLYQLPVEELDLSAETLNQLKRVGIDTVGDCVDLFYVDPFVFRVPIRFTKSAEDELKSKLVEHGYYPSST